MRPGSRWRSLGEDQQVVDHLAVHAHAGQVADDHAGPAVRTALNAFF
jgi:hypothetical protein